MDCTIQKVDQDYRILLPRSLLRHATWIKGDDPIQAWLLLGGPGRCRLLSSDEVRADANCNALFSAIEAEKLRAELSASEFLDEATMTLGLRLLSIEINPRGPGWRLTVPKVLAAIMQIRPMESSVALLLINAHMEIWTMETLRQSVTVPLINLI